MSLLKGKRYLGDVRDSSGDYLGNLYKDAAGYWIADVAYGKVKSSNGPLPPSAFKRTGSLRTSSAQTVNEYIYHYELRTKGNP